MTPARPLHRQLKDMADKRITEWFVWLCPRVTLSGVCYISVRLFQKEISEYSLQLHLFFGVIPLVGTLKPHWMTPKVFYAYHVLNYCFMIYHSIIVGSRIDFLSDGRARVCFRFMLAIIHAKPRVCLGLGTVYAAAVSPWYDPVDLRQEMLVSFWVTLGAGVIAWYRDAEFLAQLEAKEARNFESTAGGLLSSVCDAVVHLSEDLQLSQQCPHLASLLLRSSSDMRAGVPFADLAFDATEKDRLTRFLERPMSDTFSIHVSFKDAWGMPVRLELFHARGVNIHDDLIHIVGMKEYQEEWRAPPPSVLDEKLVVPNSKGLNIISEDSINLSGSSASSALLMDDQCAGMQVQINPEECGMPVIGCSPEFLRLCGPLCEETKLMPWVANPAEFLDWGGTAYNKAMDAYEGNPVQDDGLTLQLFRIRLQLPHMKPSVHEISANVSVHLEVKDGDDSGAAPAPQVFLILEDVREKRKKRKVRRASVVQPRGTITRARTTLTL